MALIKRVAPVSAFKVGLVVYGCLGLIIGAFCTLFAIFGSPYLSQAQLPMMGRFVGLFAILICPVVYGIIGGIAALIGALLFNLAASWLGGLEVDIT